MVTVTDTAAAEGTYGTSAANSAWDIARIISPEATTADGLMEVDCMVVCFGYGLTFLHGTRHFAVTPYLTERAKNLTAKAGSAI
jgi:hypothetical protein